MLILTSILLFTFGVLGSATDDDFCDQSPEHCFTPELDLDFPDSEEALDKICPLLIPRFKCLLDFKNKCRDKKLNRQFENIDNVYGLLVDACDKESKLHKNLAIQLPCIEEVRTSHYNTCKPMVEEALEEMTSGLVLDLEADYIYPDDENFAKYFCMSEALGVSCFVASTSVRCGEKTGEMVGTVLDQIGFLDIFCPENIREEVKAAVAIVQPFMELEIATEEILSTIK